MQHPHIPPAVCSVLHTVPKAPETFSDDSSDEAADEDARLSRTRDPSTTAQFLPSTPTELHIMT